MNNNNKIVDPKKTCYNQFEGLLKVVGNDDVFNINCNCYYSMLTTKDKHIPGCQRVARLHGQFSTGYDWERAAKVT